MGGRVRSAKTSCRRMVRHQWLPAVLVGPAASTALWLAVATLVLSEGELAIAHMLATETNNIGASLADVEQEIHGEPSRGADPVTFLKLMDFINAPSTKTS